MAFGDVITEENSYKFKNDDANVNNPNTKMTIFDTGTSFVMIPYTYWDAFTK